MQYLQHGIVQSLRTLSYLVYSVDSDNIPKPLLKTSGINTYAYATKRSPLHGIAWCFTAIQFFITNNLLHVTNVEGSIISQTKLQNIVFNCIYHSSQIYLQALYLAVAVAAYLPLIASRGDPCGGQTVAFAPAAVGQPLAVLHHTTLGLLRVKGHFLDGQVLILLLSVTL